MKNIATKLLLSSAIMTSLVVQGQVRVPVTNNDLRINLQKVITGFPHELSAIKGDTLADNPQTIEYASRLDFQLAQDNMITQYKSVKPIYSWQATLLVTEEFEEAADKYNWLVNQLKVMTVNLEGGYSFTLHGKYNEPTESLKFTTSVFRLMPSALNLPKLKIEASMHFEFPEWKVCLLVYEKEREDAERGEIFE